MITIILALIFAQGINLCPDENFCLACKPGPEAGHECLHCDKRFLDPISKRCTLVTRGIVENCSEYSMEKSQEVPRCINCSIGYTITHENTCLKCPSQNCAYCDEKGVCKACINGILLVNEVCEISQKCPLENCFVYDDSNNPSSCQQCNNGYSLDQNNICVEGPSDCLKIVDSNQSACAFCSSGHYLTLSNTCLSNPETSSSNSTLLWTVLAILFLLGVAFYYYRVYRQGERQNLVKDDYVTVS